MRKDHWKVKGNFQEVAESGGDFLRMERVGRSFRWTIGAVSEEDGITTYRYFPVFFFCGVTVCCCLA